MSDRRATRQKRNNTTLRAVVVAALAACLIVGCRETSTTPERPTVVLYVSVDEYIAREVIKQFEATNAIDVQFVGDTEASKTTGLVQRLRSERDHPVADVFWSSEVFQTIGLANDGLLASYDSEITQTWPDGFHDEQGRWYGFAARPRVLVYSPARLDPSDVPSTWEALTDPRWSGRLVMADPRFGTTGGHLAAMRVRWGEDRYHAFLDGLAKNRMRLLPSGNAGVVESVAMGEADLGLTDTDDVWAAQTRGLGVALVYPRHDDAGVDGGGTLLIPNTVSLVRGADPNGPAGTLVDFLLSAEVARLLAESTSHNIPVRPALAAEYPSFLIDDPLEVDLDEAARLRLIAIEEAMDRLTTGGAG